jgi:HAD superfamily hydrolase (TIGR01450 family)
MTAVSLPTFSAITAFEYYEQVRHRLPQATFPSQSITATNLAAIAPEIDVFVFDAFGVLNVGETAIAGAAEQVATLRLAGKTVFILTNSASFTARQNRLKFERLGFDFRDEEIISSRMAAENALSTYDVSTWGVIGTRDFQPSELSVQNIAVDEAPADYRRADGFLLLSTANWSDRCEELLSEAIAERNVPVVVANPDVVAPREQGLSTEPGYIGHQLANRFQIDVDFHGKPFRSVFDLVSARLPPQTDPTRVCMVGDTLHTDVLGGAAQGWKTALVSDHGLFKGMDVAALIEQSAIVPDWIIPSI